MSIAEDDGHDIGLPDYMEGWDELEQETNGRIRQEANGNPTCSNCESENIKRSKAGNLYCADLCWVDEPSSGAPEEVPNTKAGLPMEGE